MGTFNTRKIINADSALIPSMANKITDYFKSEGYDSDVKVSALGTYDISLTKGGMFKAVLGLKTALKITLKPEMNGVLFDAGIGIFGQQLIPTVIMLFVTWPVVLTQVWGIVKQANLDDTALILAESVALTSPRPAECDYVASYCPECGGKHDVGMKFCPHCGTKL